MDVIAATGVDEKIKRLTETRREIRERFREADGLVEKLQCMVVLMRAHASLCEDMVQQYKVMIETLEN